MKHFIHFKTSLLISAIFFLCSFDRYDRRENISQNAVLETGEISLKNMDHDILGYVNMHRKSMGLRPLQLSYVECRVATKHSFNMASGKTPFGHQDLKKRMDLIASQVGYISETGENVAFGQMDAREVVDGWLKSPGHRKNIEGDFTLTGIGIAKDRKGMIYYTQIFTK
jgi:uncharacterized protein YkwD